MIKYRCSDGSTVSQATIDRKRSEAYRERYSGGPFPVCEGCGATAQGSSHIVSQKRCKELGKTELIWTLDNFTPACNVCNSRWESNDSTLMNYEECMEIVAKYDPERYQKRLK